MKKNQLSVFIPRTWAVGHTYVNRRAHERKPSGPRTWDEVIPAPKAQKQPELSILIPRLLLVFPLHPSRQTLWFVVFHRPSAGFVFLSA